MIKFHARKSFGNDCQKCENGPGVWVDADDPTNFICDNCFSDRDLLLAQLRKVQSQEIRTMRKRRERLWRAKLRRVKFDRADR